MIKQIMNKKRDKSGEINFPTDLPRWALFSCEECRQTAGSSVHPSSALKWDHPIRLLHILKQDILQLIASETNTAGFSVNCNQFPYYVLSIFPLELIKAGRSSHIGDEATFWGSTFIERGVLKHWVGGKGSFRKQLAEEEVKHNGVWGHWMWLLCPGMNVKLAATKYTKLIEWGI